MVKKTKKTIASAKADFASRHEILKSGESYKSLMYGIITVVLLFIVGFSVVKLFSTPHQGTVDDGAVSVERINEAMQASSNTYTVKEGETLWSIAESKYGSGFEWQKIAAANKISDASRLEKGTALVIPDDKKEIVDKEEVMEPDTVIEQKDVDHETAVEAEKEKTDVVMEAPTTEASHVEVAAGEKITGGTYVIKHGDDLWDIAVRAYGDGYKWTQIAAANNLSDPDLIHADNTLKLPRT